MTVSPNGHTGSGLFSHRRNVKSVEALCNILFNSLYLSSSATLAKSEAETHQLRVIGQIVKAGVIVGVVDSKPRKD